MVLIRGMHKADECEISKIKKAKHEISFAL